MPDKRDFRTSGYLKVGDVVLLHQGTPVKCAYCPRCLDENASIYETGVFDTTILIGVVKQRQAGLSTMRKAVAENIEGIFQFFNIPLNRGIMNRFIINQIPEVKIGPFLIHAGLYRVTQIEPHPRYLKITMQTYKPATEAELHEIYIYQGGFHATHMNNIQVVANPD